MHTMHTTITESSTVVHMSVLTCGHLCIRTHLRAYILSVTSSYPILHTHHTRKLRFKFPASRGRGLIPEVLHGDGRKIIPVAHFSGVGSCEIDRDAAAKALPRPSRPPHKTRRPWTAPELSMSPNSKVTQLPGAKSGTVKCLVHAKPPNLTPAITGTPVLQRAQSGMPNRG